MTPNYKHIVDLHCTQNDLKINLTFDGDDPASEWTHKFARFMIACGFSESTIKEVFEQGVEI